MLSPDLPSLLANGIPPGLIGVGVDVDALSDASHLTTIKAALAGTRFDNKSGMVQLTFNIPPEHQYLAIALRDAARKQLVLIVHSSSPMTREKFGKSAATTPNLAQQRAKILDDQIRDKHARRVYARKKKEWVGDDGPED